MITIQISEGVAALLLDLIVALMLGGWALRSHFDSTKRAYTDGVATMDSACRFLGGIAALAAIIMAFVLAISGGVS